MRRGFWDTDHKLITDSSAPGQLPIPMSSKATFWSRFGSGRCNCTGSGFLERLAAARLGHARCSRSPGDSKFRAMLKAAWVFIEFDGCLVPSQVAILATETADFVKAGASARSVRGSSRCTSYLSPSHQDRHAHCCNQRFAGS